MKPEVKNNAEKFNTNPFTVSPVTSALYTCINYQLIVSVPYGEPLSGETLYGDQPYSAHTIELVAV